jgi:hypothetical protein
MDEIILKNPREIFCRRRKKVTSGKWLFYVKIDMFVIFPASKQVFMGSAKKKISIFREN